MIASGYFSDSVNLILSTIATYVFEHSCCLTILFRFEDHCSFDDSPLWLDESYPSKYAQEIRLLWQKQKAEMLGKIVGPSVTLSSVSVH